MQDAAKTDRQQQELLDMLGEASSFCLEDLPSLQLMLQSEKLLNLPFSCKALKRFATLSDKLLKGKATAATQLGKRDQLLFGCFFVLELLRTSPYELLQKYIPSWEVALLEAFWSSDAGVSIRIAVCATLRAYLDRCSAEPHMKREAAQRRLALYPVVQRLLNANSKQKKGSSSAEVGAACALLHSISSAGLSAALLRSHYAELEVALCTAVTTCHMLPCFVFLPTAFSCVMLMRTNAALNSPAARILRLCRSVVGELTGRLSVSTAQKEDELLTLILSSVRSGHHVGIPMFRFLMGTLTGLLERGGFVPVAELLELFRECYCIDPMLIRLDSDKNHMHQNILPLHHVVQILQRDVLSGITELTRNHRRGVCIIAFTHQICVELLRAVRMHSTSHTCILGALFRTTAQVFWTFGFGVFEPLAQPLIPILRSVLSDAFSCSVLSEETVLCQVSAAACLETVVQLYCHQIPKDMRALIDADIMAIAFRGEVHVASSAKESSLKFAITQLLASSACHPTPGAGSLLCYADALGLSKLQHPLVNLPVVGTASLCLAEHSNVREDVACAAGSKAIPENSSFGNTPSFTDRQSETLAPMESTADSRKRPREDGITEVGSLTNLSVDVQSDDTSDRSIVAKPLTPSRHHQTPIHLSPRPSQTKLHSGANENQQTSNGVEDLLQSMMVDYGPDTSDDDEL